MSPVLDQVSVIIPLAPAETAQQQLLNDLKPLSNEVITCSQGTRAKSLNHGAAISSKPFLWFLHADSRVSKDNLSALEQNLKSNPKALNYFDLGFTGSGLVNFNAGAANLRSRWFKLPYGDQGFCISAKLFKQLGGFPEQLPYGEDLLLVRMAKKLNIPINRIPSKLITSSRKYRQQGWLKLTVLHQKKMIQLLRMKL